MVEHAFHVSSSSPATSSRSLLACRGGAADAGVAARGDLEAEAVRIEEERRVVVRVVDRPEARGVQDLGAGCRPLLRRRDRRPPCARRRSPGDGSRAHRARTAAPRAPAAGRSSPSRLAGSGGSRSSRRARPRSSCGGCRPSSPKTRRVERERALDVAADEIDVAEPDEHYFVHRLDEQRRHVDDAQLLAHRAHAVVEHHRAERARDRERLRARSPPPRARAPR